MDRLRREAQNKQPILAARTKIAARMEYPETCYFRLMVVFSGSLSLEPPTMIA
jgi:hypothetical protein